MNIMAFFVITAIVAAMSVTLGTRKLIKGQSDERYLGASLYFSACVVIAYAISIGTESMFVMSLFSSIYFSFIDLMLLTLLLYTIAFTGCRKYREFIVCLAAGYGVFDIAVLMMNPWNDISLSYRYSEMSIQHWRYEPGMLYNMHLAYCYLIIALILAVLVYKAANTSSIYRIRYMGMIGAVLFIVLANAVFLFVSDDRLPDISLLFYSIAGCIIYCSRYFYSKKKFFSIAGVEIISEMNHPILLFDADRNLVLRNKAAETLHESINNNQKTVTLGKFIRECRISDISESTEDNVTFRWIDTREENIKSYRCDYSVFKDRLGLAAGYLFVFADDSMAFDVLTGFARTSEFIRHVAEEMTDADYPVHVTVCDINNLGRINKEQGKSQGDILIKKLAYLMREHFSEGSYFVRLNEANLAAVSKNDENDAVQQIQKILAAETNVTIQTAGAIADGIKVNIVAALETAFYSMRAKKMIDKESAHSNILTLLVQTLRESDDETEEHVKRTNELGQKMAGRLKLSDHDRVRLSILCLLHDIGKVGIPLEILNKPGRLNIEEWEIMKSHADKGYRIVKSSRELDSIAELILCHHEAWNGSGYPRGLAGENIPLLSRIIAIIDAYDAMTSERVYRKTYSKAQAVAELKRCAGTQFDPQLVEEFIQVLKEENSDVESVDDASEKISHSISIFNDSYETSEDADDEVVIKALEYSKYFLNQDNEIIEADNNFEKLTGYSNKDIKSRHMNQMDLIPKMDREQYASMVNSGLNDATEVYMEHRLLRADGKIIKVHCMGNTFFNTVSRERRSEIIITRSDKEDAEGN